MGPGLFRLSCAWAGFGRRVLATRRLPPPPPTTREPDPLRLETVRLQLSYFGLMDGELPPGVYEQLLTQALARSLHDRQGTAALQSLNKHEAGDRLALHIGAMIRRAVESIPLADRLAVASQVAARLAEDLQALVPADMSPDMPTEELEVLHGIGAVQPDGSIRQYPRPLTPLVDTTLLTNSPGEPRLMSQIDSEIASADSIDLVMAFIRRSGLNPVRAALARHCAQGRRLRVLTTTYTGSTQLEALRDLTRLGAEVRVSYDTSDTRLHAKAWLFARRSGYSTAFIGSSNLHASSPAHGA